MPSSANLGPQLESYVNHLVKTGRYQSRSEVLREGVRLVEEREKRLLALDAAIAQGLEDADADRVTPADRVRSRLANKYRGKLDDGST